MTLSSTSVTFLHHSVFYIFFSLLLSSVFIFLCFPEGLFCFFPLTLFGFVLVCLLFSLICSFIEHVFYTIIQDALSIFPPPNLSPSKIISSMPAFPLISQTPFPLTPFLPKHTCTFTHNQTHLLCYYQGSVGIKTKYTWGMAETWRIIILHRAS